jgi:hypothetical protein
MMGGAIDIAVLVHRAVDYAVGRGLLVRAAALPEGFRILCTGQRWAALDPLV